MNQPTLELEQAAQLLACMESSLEASKAPPCIQVWFRDAVVHLLAAHAQRATKLSTDHAGVRIGDIVLPPTQKSA